MEVYSMPKKNTGLEYEKMAQIVFQQIVNSDLKVFQNIEVKHDIDIKGKTAMHQIDVYWEFEMGGIIYRNIVQAKDWKSKVPLKEMLAFKAILDDLPAGTAGIYVCKSGYQSGAVDYAKMHGINIYELREPKDEDWKGRLKTIVLHITMELPIYNNIHIVMDEQWIDVNLPEINKEDLKIGGYKGELNFQLFNRDFEKIPMDKFLYNRARGKGIEKEERVAIDFEKTGEPVYIKTGHINQYIKLSGIYFDFRISKSTETLTIDATDVVGMILKDIISGDRRTFDTHMVLR